MNFFSSLLQSAKRSLAPQESPGGAPSAAERAPTYEVDPEQVRKIHFDPGLIADLHSDHHALMNLYIDLRYAAENQRIADIPGLLSNLKLLLQMHAMVENVRLYAYLQQRLAHDRLVSEMLAGIKREMSSLSRELIRFIDHYSKPDALDTASLPGFTATLLRLGERLAKRIQLEEGRLYTLYLPYD